MRVTAHHLVDEAAQEGGHGEFADLLGQARVKDDLEQEVAELFLERAWVTGLDRLEDLVGLLEQKGLQGGPGLLAVPRAPAGTAQAGHHVEESVEENTGGLGHVRS